MSIARSILIRLLAASILLCSSVALAASRAYVGNFKDNTVSVIDTAAGSVVGTIPVAAGPHGMALSPDGRWLYVTSDGSSIVSIIDTTNTNIAKTLDVGQAPQGAAVTPDGKLLLVAVNKDNLVAFIDTIKQTVIASVEVPKPHTVSIKPDGKMAYVTSQDPARFGIAVVDIPNRSLSRIIKLDKQPRDLEFAPDGKTVYFTEMGVNAVLVFDPATEKIIAQIPTGESPHYVNLFRGMPVGVVVVQGPGELLLFDPVSNKPVRTIKVGSKPHWAASAGDGKTVYVTDEGSNDVTVVDISTGKTMKIPVGNQPRKIVVH